jgi:hypothetical protein
MKRGKVSATKKLVLNMDNADRVTRDKDGNITYIEKDSSLFKVSTDGVLTYLGSAGLGWAEQYEASLSPSPAAEDTKKDEQIPLLILSPKEKVVAQRKGAKRGRGAARSPSAELSPTGQKKLSQKQLPQTGKTKPSQQEKKPARATRSNKAAPIQDQIQVEADPAKPKGKRPDPPAAPRQEKLGQKMGAKLTGKKGEEPPVSPAHSLDSSLPPLSLSPKSTPELSPIPKALPKKKAPPRKTKASKAKGKSASEVAAVSKGRKGKRAANFAETEHSESDKDYIDKATLKSKGKSASEVSAVSKGRKGKRAANFAETEHSESDKDYIDKATLKSKTTKKRKSGVFIKNHGNQSRWKVPQASSGSSTPSDSDLITVQVTAKQWAEIFCRR